MQVNSIKYSLAQLRKRKNNCPLRLEMVTLKVWNFGMMQGVSNSVWCETGWTMTLENYTGNIVDDALFSEHTDEMKGTASFYATWLSVRNVWQAGWEIAREQWRDRACSTTPTDRENRNFLEDSIGIGWSVFWMDKEGKWNHYFHAES